MAGAAAGAGGVDGAAAGGVAGAAGGVAGGVAGAWGFAAAGGGVAVDSGADLPAHATIVVAAASVATRNSLLIFALRSVIEEILNSEL